MKSLRLVLLCAGLILLLSGCAPAEPADPLPGGWISGATLDQSEAGENSVFEATVEQPGDPIGIDLRGQLASGAFSAHLTDSAGTIVWEQRFDTSGAFYENTVITPAEAGTYHLGLAWEGPVQASYNLRWQPGEIELRPASPLALMGGIGMILVAIGYTVWALRQGRAWGYLGLGALGWIVTVALKFAAAILANTPIYTLLMDQLPEALALPIFDVYVGALTGFFEVGLVWLLLRYTKLGQAAWNKALAFGVGFGAVEALLLGLASLATVISAMLMPELLGPDVLAALNRPDQALYSLAPIVERLAVVMVHLSANLLLFYGAARREARWFWLAFVYKTALDTVAAAAQFWGVSTLWQVWTIEAILLAFGVAGYFGLRWLHAHYPAEAADPIDTPPPSPEP